MAQRAVPRQRGPVVHTSNKRMSLDELREHSRHECSNNKPTNDDQVGNANLTPRATPVARPTHRCSTAFAVFGTHRAARVTSLLSGLYIQLLDSLYKTSAAEPASQLKSG
jgi:hypothetical protein